MKLFEGFGPNPRAARWFLLEKGMEIPSQQVNIMTGENRQPPFTDINPGGQLPALELDSGEVIAETIPIFEYLEEKQPEPALIGSTPEERAEARMWLRRVELKITEALYDGFRFAEGHGLFKDRMHCIPEAAEGLKARSRAGQAWIDPLLAGKTWICGDRFTIADIVLACALDFGSSVGQPAETGLPNFAAWQERVAKRPAFEASLHPMAEQAGMKG